MANMQVRVASLTSSCFRKHRPSASTLNGGMARDLSFLIHTGRLYDTAIAEPLPHPSARCPATQPQNANVWGIIKALLYSADQGLTL